ANRFSRPRPMAESGWVSHLAVDQVHNQALEQACRLFPASDAAIRTGKAEAFAYCPHSIVNPERETVALPPFFPSAPHSASPGGSAREGYSSVTAGDPAAGNA
ncbi:hypothetical protein, partial [Acetobacter papayae]|uniref:hypothetical protein n=1 Tax=Acetobacter papayae TaxID=1076592 RepID=UPI001F22D81B